MILWSPGTRFLRGALACAGLGFLAGALETVGLAATLRLPLGFGGFLLLGVACVLSMGVVGALCGAVAGLVHAQWRFAPFARAMAGHLGLAAFLLCGWYLWEAAATLWADDRLAAAGIMAVMPVAFGGVVYFNARYWWRRLEIGAAPRVGWLPLSLLAAAVVALGSAAGYAVRDTGGAGALAGDANVVLVTVDGLRHDEVFGPDARAFEGLADDAVRFRNAVSPMPAPLPANTTVLTGLHPLRHEVLRPPAALASGYTTLAEVLEGEGWATGGFVSSSTLGGAAGLDQGFRTFDDAVGAGLPGLGKLSPLRRARGLLGSGPAHRAPAHTVDRFLAWFDRHQGVPFFAWVHLDAPAGDDHQAGVQAAVEAVGTLDGAVRAAGLEGRTLLVLAGTHGWMQGEHGVQGAPRGLWDPAVLVPVLMRAPGATLETRDVGQQVRLMDIAPTVVDYLELPAMDQTEGIDLLGYAEGAREQGMWSSLVGWAGDDLFDTALIGLRNNGVKYVRAIRTGEETLYQVDTDPDESDDLAATHAETLDRARGLIASEEAALRALLRERP